MACYACCHSVLAIICAEVSVLGSRVRFVSSASKSGSHSNFVYVSGASHCRTMMNGTWRANFFFPDENCGAFGVRPRDIMHVSCGALVVYVIFHARRARRS
jgi:hypothetical protein